jgi:hypothetical protein
LRCCTEGNTAIAVKINIIGDTGTAQRTSSIGRNTGTAVKRSCIETHTLK